MNRYDVINTLINTFGYKRYLEIGVSTGSCYRKVKCETMVSVDPCDRTIHPYIEEKDWYPVTHKCTSDVYFQKHIDKPFDIIFIDGLHHADQVKKDIENSLKWLTENGTIVCHDMNPQTEEAQIIPIHPGIWNGDCWKALVRMRMIADYHNIKVYTINTDEGLGVIRHGKQNSLILPDHVQRLEYRFLEQYRKEWLNLITVDEFWGWIEAHGGSRDDYIRETQEINVILKERRCIYAGKNPERRT